MMALVLIVFTGAVGYVTMHHSNSPQSSTDTQSPQPVSVDTHGMQEYVDPELGFTFWYPSGWKIATTSGHDTKEFPGGTLVHTIEIGPAGGVVAYVVASAHSSITDESNGHASPVNQTKYFYDEPAGQWMIAYPEGTPAGSPPGTTTADISHTTASGLIMLRSGRRFDTSIIPLSSTDFLVISDGGGEGATPLASTVALVGQPIASSTLSGVLLAESNAYAQR